MYYPIYEKKFSLLFNRIRCWFAVFVTYALHMCLLHTRKKIETFLQINKMEFHPNIFFDLKLFYLNRKQVGASLL